MRRKIQIGSNGGEKAMRKADPGFLCKKQPNFVYKFLN